MMMASWLFLFSGGETPFLMKNQKRRKQKGQRTLNLFLGLQRIQHPVLVLLLGSRRSRSPAE